MHPMIEIIIIRYCHQLSAGEALQFMKHNATISVKRKATATAAFFHLDEICLPISGNVYLLKVRITLLLIAKLFGKSFPDTSFCGNFSVLNR